MKGCQYLPQGTVVVMKRPALVRERLCYWAWVSTLLRRLLPSGAHVPGLAGPPQSRLIRDLDRMTASRLNFSAALSSGRRYPVVHAPMFQACPQASPLYPSPGSSCSLQDGPRRSPQVLLCDLSQSSAAPYKEDNHSIPFTFYLFGAVLFTTDP